MQLNFCYVMRVHREGYLNSFGMGLCAAERTSGAEEEAR
jgi:hypothetical protein